MTDRHLRTSLEQIVSWNIVKCGSTLCNILVSIKHPFKF